MSERAELKPVQSLIDDALRDNLRAVLETCANEEDDDPITETSVLTGWVVMSAWLDPIDGETRYFRLNSAGMAIHEKLGLLRQGLFDE